MSYLLSTPILALMDLSLLFDKLREVSVVSLYNREENLVAPIPYKYCKENVWIINLSMQLITYNFVNLGIDDKSLSKNQQFLRTQQREKMTCRYGKLKKIYQTK